MSDDVRRHVLLGALLVALAVPKVWFNVHVDDFGPDGGLYTDVAMHLRDGHGLSTIISDFTHGFTTFPHPSSIYPAWPALYALALAIGGALGASVSAVGVWLPTLLYFTSLVAAYRFGRAWAPAALAGPTLGGRVPLDGGHVFALVLGANVAYAEYTSKPYTEGLSFTLLFLFLARARALLAGPGSGAARLADVARRAFECGLWLAALLYCRSHFIIVPVALAGALLVEGALRVRRARGDVAPVLVFAAVALASLTLAFAPFLAYMGTFVDDAGLRTYFRFDQARALATAGALPRFELESAPLGAAVLERLDAAWRAYWPGWRPGFFTSYRALALVPALALVAALVAAVPWARGRSARVATPATPEQLGPGPHAAPAWRALVVLVALGGLASVHLIRQDAVSEWLFATRHGAIAALAFALLFVALLRAPSRPVRLAALALLVVGAADCVRVQLQEAQREARGSRVAPVDGWRPALVAWIAAAHREAAARGALDGAGGRGSGDLALALTRSMPRKLAWRLPAATREGVGLHGLGEWTSAADVLTFTDALGVRFVIVSTETFDPAFARDPVFTSAFREVARVAEARGPGKKHPAIVYERAAEVTSAPGTTAP